MTIKVGKLSDAFPGYTTPHSRACMLAYAGRDYLSVCMFVRERHMEIGPLFSFSLPTMHQTLELFTKAVVFKVDPEFDPKRFSHKVLKLVRAYANSVPVFASMVADPKTVELLQELEKSYFGVRYGECYQSSDGETWQLFVSRATELLDDLHSRTNLPFLAKHYQGSGKG